MALPGGTGTLDEISEVMSLKRLGRLGSEVRPVMIYNINGYYDHFLRFLDRMTAEGFNREIDRAGILEVRSIGDIEKALMTAGTADTERITAYDK
ncbi:MAG: LOG family protein [Mogibacterium sp.]|nr:LOG family protein [Mogibacterium sp.]